MFGKLKMQEKIASIVYDAIIKASDNKSLDIKENEIVNSAMILGKALKTNPRNIATIIIDNIDTSTLPIKEIAIAGAGFINFTLGKEWLYEEIKDILTLEENYGKISLSERKKANVEYVSANPTGPLHIGNARGGAIGDVMANILKYAGYEVEKEFYLNDAGNQIIKFGMSLEARYLQELGQDIPFPEDGYQGGDITLLVKKYISENNKDLSNVREEERREALVDFALSINTDNMIKDLVEYGIKYDKVFSENSLYESGKIEKALDRLRKSDSVYEKDGATWFNGIKYGLEKDEVLIRNNGVPTYYLADIAYHYDKFDRGADLAINVWGADHHGHVARIKKAMVAGGIEEERLEVILMQLVHLVKNNETVRLSKRKGEIYTLTDLVSEVGKDSARFTFNHYKPNTHMDFDLDLAIKMSSENPVFYVQYAYARICSIIRNIDKEVKIDSLDLLIEKEEITLLKNITGFSSEIISACEDLDPSKITKFALNIASSFHSFYNAHRVKLDDEKLQNARLCLVAATKQVLKNSLDILGVHAPEKM